jgi:hypothetical protein
MSFLSKKAKIEHADRPKFENTDLPPKFDDTVVNEVFYTHDNIHKALNVVRILNKEFQRQDDSIKKFIIGVYQEAFDKKE